MMCAWSRGSTDDKGIHTMPNKCKEMGCDGSNQNCNLFIGTVPDALYLVPCHQGVETTYDNFGYNIPFGLLNNMSTEDIHLLIVNKIKFY